MSNQTPAHVADELLAGQVIAWRKEVARLNDLIAHAVGAPVADERAAFDEAFLSWNGFHTKAELDAEWAHGTLAGSMFREGWKRGIAAGAQGPDVAVENDGWVHTKEGLPIPASYARVLYEGWKAQSGITMSFDEFMGKYKYFLSLDSIGACWGHCKGGPAICAAILSANSPREAG